MSALSLSAFSANKPPELSPRPVPVVICTEAAEGGSMKYTFGIATVAFASLLASGLTTGVCNAAGGPPPWAYGTSGPAAPGNSAPPPAAAGGRGQAAQAAPDDGALKHLPGSSGAFTLTQIRNAFGPADWYPDDHPAMPDIVAHGRRPDV